MLIARSDRVGACTAETRYVTSRLTRSVDGGCDATTWGVDAVAEIEALPAIRLIESSVTLSLARRARMSHDAWPRYRTMRSTHVSRVCMRWTR